mgnify:CR=1 FL=1
MKKFLSISILTILGLTVLSGCQLAKKENTPSAVTKHLVGIYCTATPLDDQEEPIMIRKQILSNRIIPISPAAILPQLKLMYPKKKEISIIRSVPI